MFAVNSNDLPSQNKYLTLIILPVPKCSELHSLFSRSQTCKVIHHPIDITRYLVCVSADGLASFTVSEYPHLSIFSR
jgi:hypothetical protein